MIEPISADEAMDRYADGDDAAFGVVYDALAPRPYGYALRWTQSRPAAEDVVQETFLQIHGVRASFVRGTSVLPWTYAIARRLIIDASWRRGREELRSHDPTDGQARSAELAADEARVPRQDQQDARWLLEGLPPALREAFWLVKLEGLSVVQAAEVLEITPGLVKVRWARSGTADSLTTPPAFPVLPSRIRPGSRSRWPSEAAAGCRTPRCSRTGSPWPARCSRTVRPSRI